MSNIMRLYHYDDKGMYIRTTEARQSPLVPGEFRIPAKATKIRPSREVLNKTTNGYFDGEMWAEVEPENDPAVNPYAGLSLHDAKLQALAISIVKIDAEVRLAQSQLFIFQEHNFYPDILYIQSVLSVLSLFPAGFTKNWKTANVEADGISNLYVTLNKSGIAGLALALFAHIEKEWNDGDIKKKMIKQMVNDSSKTYRDILNYVS